MPVASPETHQGELTCGECDRAVMATYGAFATLKMKRCLISGRYNGDLHKCDHQKSGR